MVVAIEFLLPCGHTVSQAIRNVELVPRDQVYDAMDQARDKLAYWLTRHAIPQHDCVYVTEDNPNGIPYMGGKH